VNRLQRSAQSTVEAMLAMSVLTVAIAAAAYVLIGPLDVGVTAMDQDMRIVLDDARPASTSGRR